VERDTVLEEDKERKIAEGDLARRREINGRLSREMKKGGKKKRGKEKKVAGSEKEREEIVGRREGGKMIKKINGKWQRGSGI